MKFYDLDTEFTFGKYQGKTVRQIIDLQPSYFEWCAMNLDHFYISNEVIQEIQIIIPNFSISQEGQISLDKKYKIWEDEQDDYNDSDSYEDSTDWSNYDDNLDMDQQGFEFWNQF